MMVDVAVSSLCPPSSCAAHLRGKDVAPDDLCLAPGSAHLRHPEACLQKEGSAGQEKPFPEVGAMKHQ